MIHFQINMFMVNPFFYHVCDSGFIISVLDDLQGIPAAGAEFRKSPVTHIRGRNDVQLVVVDVPQKLPVLFCCQSDAGFRGEFLGAGSGQSVPCKCFQKKSRIPSEAVIIWPENSGCPRFLPDRQFHLYFRSWK
jgi:hypothetical protein